MQGYFTISLMWYNGYRNRVKSSVVSIMQGVGGRMTAFFLFLNWSICENTMLTLY